MASKKTVNAKNLEALGASRLAELLIEITGGDAAAKRRLRLELAAAEDSGAVVKEIRKRLTSLARSRAYVDWRKLRSLAAVLETQRGMIVERVAKDDLGAALELLWRFLALANSVLDRCDDSNGALGDIFRTAVGDLGKVAQAAQASPEALADAAYQGLISNDYGQYDELISLLAPALGQAGLERLKQRVISLSKEPLRRPPDQERRVIAYGPKGPLFSDEMAEHSRKSRVRLALMEIADAQGDVDAYVAQYDEQTRRVPRVAAEIARRLLAAGRPQEAWQMIEGIEPGGSDRLWPDFEWEDARIAVLEALGRSGDAQAARWSCFERSLSVPHLRAYLKRLPDFEDIEAEERALDHVQRFDSLHSALSFLVAWPALDRASALVIRRAGELDGDRYEILAPAASVLADKYPLAATLVFRSLIDFSLAQARSSRYRHAARHLEDCASLAASVADFGSFETHEAYVARLKAEHGRKRSFWSLLS